MIPMIVLTYTLFFPIIETPHVASPGMVWHNAHDIDHDVLGFESYYNYTLRPNEDTDLPFLPFFWCATWPPLAYGSAELDYFEDAEVWLGDGYSGWLLFLNEPDLPGTDTGGQCEMTPRQAAYLYKSVVDIYPDAKIVGPNISGNDHYFDFVWLEEWLDIVSNQLGLPLPAVAAVHTYHPTDDPTEIVDDMLLLLEEYDGAERVWVTEFGACSPERANEMIYAFRNHPKVDRYFWYTTRSGGCSDLFYRDDTLTPVGEVWRNYHKTSIKAEVSCLPACHNCRLTLAPSGKLYYPLADEHSYQSFRVDPSELDRRTSRGLPILPEQRQVPSVY